MGNAYFVLKFQFPSFFIKENKNYTTKQSFPVVITKREDHNVVIFFTTGVKDFHNIAITTFLMKSAPGAYFTKLTSLH